MPPAIPEEVYDAMHSQLMWTIGIMVGILLTGGLISFGISCIFLLSENKDLKVLKQHRLLRVYIAALLCFVTGYIVVEVLTCNAFLIFDLHLTPSQAKRSKDLVGFFCNMSPVFVAALTDGLLVWRCYMVHKLSSCPGPSKWGNVFWIFPTCLWGLTSVAGTIAAFKLMLANPAVASASVDVQAAALISNVALNIYATLYISARLLKHRRMIETLARQRVDMSRYLSVVSILLESAAINVPVTIAVAVGVGLGASFGAIMLPTVVSGQAFASVIIIHQVAVGRAFGRMKEEELDQLTIEEQRPDSQVRSTDSTSKSLGGSMIQFTSIAELATES